MKKLRLQYNAPVFLTFSLLSLAALLLGQLTGGISTQKLFSVYRSSLSDPLTYPRFVLYVLGHANFEHYVNNIMMLLVLGPALEERYGSRLILRAVFLTALVGGLLQWFLFPSYALLGASGIVFMCITMASATGTGNGRIPITLILVFVLYLGNEIWTGLTQPDNISQFTHIAGGICGAFFGFTYSKRRKV